MVYKVFKVLFIFSLLVLSLVLSRWSNDELCLNSRLVGNIYIYDTKTQKIPACEPGYYLSFSEGPKWPSGVKDLVESLQDVLVLSGHGFSGFEKVSLWIDYSKKNTYEVFPNILQISSNLLKPEILKKAFLKIWILQQKQQGRLSLYGLNLRAEALAKIIYNPSENINIYQSIQDYQSICSLRNKFPEMNSLCDTSKRSMDGEENGSLLYKDTRFRQWAFIDIYAEYLKYAFLKLSPFKQQQFLSRLAIGVKNDFPSLAFEQERAQRSSDVVNEIYLNLELLNKYFSITSHAVTEEFLKNIRNKTKAAVVMNCGTPNFKKISTLDARKLLVINDCNGKMELSWKPLLDNDVKAFIQQNPLMKYYLVHNPSLRIALKNSNVKNLTDL
ncbi:MAG: hypothetical protein KDD50_16275, partial [Bdellovibrionales bacterium]|nr:hypothetical protein [Bdellovibrionales bacterium]